MYQCENGVRTIAGRGRWFVKVERKAYGGLDRLVAALRRPNAPQPSNVICPADLIMVSPFALVGRHGQLVRPTVPTDVCDQPQAQTLDALKALRWVTVSSRPVRQIETQAELTSGCDPAWKDLFRQPEGALYPAVAGPVFKGRPTSVTVCVFRDAPGMTGDLVRDGKLSGASAATVLRGMSGGRRSTGCAGSHAMFAVLWPTATGQTGPTAYVELGGCDRVLRIHDVINRSKMIAVEHDEIGRASPAAIGTIEHVDALTSHRHNGS